MPKIFVFPIVWAVLFFLAFYFFNAGSLFIFILTGVIAYPLAKGLASGLAGEHNKKPTKQQEKDAYWQDLMEGKGEKKKSSLLEYWEGQQYSREEYNNIFRAIDECTGSYDNAYFRSLDKKLKTYMKLNMWLWFEGREPKEMVNTVTGTLKDSINFLNMKYREAEQECTGERFKVIKDVMEGSTAWLQFQDVEKGGTLYGINEPGALRLGTIEEGCALTYKGEGSLISVGGAGSGKTQGQVLPNLCFYHNSVVILDIKGECYRNTAEYRKVVLKSKIIRFAPFDPDNSHYYNPISFIRQDQQYFWEDVREAAALFLIETPKDSYWEHAAREVLQGVIAYLAKTENANASIEGMLDILGSKLEAADDEPPTLWERFMDGLREASDSKAMQRCANGIEDVYNMSAKQFIGVKDGLKAHLARWQGGNLEEVTKRSDWTPEDLLKERTTLYITIPADKVDQYGELMRVFIAQHINALLRKEKEHENDQEVLFMLDEFAKMGTIPEVQKGLEIGRSYGVRFWVFLQSLSQLDQLYDNSEALLDNFYVQSYLDFPDKTAQNLSRKLGSSDGTFQPNNVPLVSVQELQTEFSNNMIVIGKGVKPAKLEKLVFYGLLEDTAKNAIEEMKVKENQV